MLPTEDQRRLDRHRAEEPLEADKLVTEIEGAGLRKLVESYAIVPNRIALIVSLEFEGGGNNQRPP